MNATTLEQPDVRAYLDAVRAQLADLPADERDDLVADLEASLIETGEPPALSPEDFASELREAAGLAPDTEAPAERSLLDSLRSWLTYERVASWRDVARELAPIWWLARAYVATAVVALLAGWGWPLGSSRSDTFSIETSFLVLAAASVMSVWLGLRGRRRRSARSRGGIVANLALAVLALPIAVYSFDQVVYAPYAELVPSYEPTPGLARDGVPVRNLFPYSRDGRLLLDVLLFDESGRSINITSEPEDTSRRVLLAEDGSVIFNSFPIRYYEPGTKTVARPTLGPPVTVPEVVTPPLKLPRKDEGD